MLISKINGTTITIVARLLSMTTKMKRNDGDNNSSVAAVAC